MRPCRNSNPIVETFSSGVDRDLIESCQQFSRLLSTFEILVPPISAKAIASLPALPVEKKTQAVQFLSHWITWIKSSLEQNKHLRYDERKTLKKALEHYGLSVHDDFWKTIDRDHIIEVYSSDMRQIYRSINFFQVTGYSLLDLMTFEWFTLWERPKPIKEELFRITTKFSSEFIPVSPVGVPVHLLMETMDTGLTEPFMPHSCLVDFQFIGSLTNTQSGNLAGFIATAKARVLEVGEDINRFACI